MHVATYSIVVHSYVLFLIYPLLSAKLNTLQILQTVLIYLLIHLFYFILFILYGKYDKGLQATCVPIHVRFTVKLANYLFTYSV